MAHVTDLPAPLPLPADAPTRSRVAYDGIRDRILDGRIPEGVRLREGDLAEAVGVSRVPVREAIPYLVSAGFLESLGRRGLIVPRVSERAANDHYDLRAALESLAARRAAEQAAAGVPTAELDEAIAEAEDALARDDMVAFTGANGRIHLAIERIAANDVLHGVMSVLRERNLRLNRVGLHDAPADRHAEHVGIAAAIAQGDAETAAALAFAHIERVRQRTLGSIHSTASAEDQPV